MIKDLLVNLTESEGRDVAGPFAISIAEAFDAHLAAVAFSYEPVIPPTIMGGIPASFIDEQPRRERQGCLRRAQARFEAAAKRSGISFGSRIVNASIAGAADPPRTSW